MYSRYYEILGLTEDASLKKVRKAYLKLVLKYHPDRNPDREDAGKRMTEINGAYTVLYRYLQKSPQPFSAIDGASDLGIDYVNDPEYKWLYSKQPEHKDNDTRGDFRRLIFFENFFWVILTVFCFLIWWCILSLLLFIPYSFARGENEGNGVLFFIALGIFFLWLYLFKQLLFIKNE